MNIWDLKTQSEVLAVKIADAMDASNSIRII